MPNDSTTQALDELIPMGDEIAIPVTPQPSHATIDNPTATAQSSRLTPPPTNSRVLKERTPTPTYSSISTPPPTVEDAIAHKRGGAGVVDLDQDELANSSAEELRKIVTGLQTAYQEAKMSAAHYKLQYQMLEQESTAAMERMAVEARMAQYENEIIHIAEQAKAAATPAQSSPAYQDGMIPVQKDLYQSMCLEIQHLNRLASSLYRETRRQEHTILNQENEIESLTDKVNIMRDRIRANREQVRSLSAAQSIHDQAHRRVYATPQRGQDNFAALLQASEMASQEAKPSRKRKVTMTPQRYNKQATFLTPSRERPFVAPASAPAPRLDPLSMAASYASRPQALQQTIVPAAPRSEDTVSNSDRDFDSEAETDIIELQGNVNESQASRAAGLMLRSDQEGSFHGIPPAQPAAAPPKLKQTRLFGAIRKPNIDRADERPSKKARTAGPGIGLGIVNAR